MRKVTLIKLKINNNVSIDFKEGLNYIIGNNGSGKTIVFNLIQHLLGMGNLSNQNNEFFNKFSEARLVCRFGEIEVTFSRVINEVLIIFKDKIEKVKANSSELSALYNNLLLVDSFELNSKDSLNLLKTSFLSELDVDKLLLIKNTETLKILLGVDSRLESNLKNDIQVMTEHNESRKTSISTILNFINSIGEKINSVLDVTNIEKLKVIFSDEISGIDKDIKNNDELIYNAKSMLREIERNNQNVFNKKLSENEHYFKEITSKLNVKANLNGLIQRSNKGLINNSMGQNILIMVSLLLTLMRNLNFGGGPGLLLMDSIGYSLDKKGGDNLKRVINEVTKNNELQYIEFSSDTRLYNNDNFVFNLESVRGDIFEDKL